MIDVKIIAKAKSGDSASSSSTVVVQKSAVADEATRAARADFADAANKAGYADLSGYADRAGTAEVAYGLTDDNIIKDQFLSKVIDDTAAGNITFAQDIAVTGNASIGGDVAVTGDVTADNVEANAADIDSIITESVKTATFDADPLVGVGFGIYVDTQLNNATKAVVDYLTVRKGMKVAVLEIAEYRSVNGGLVLSPANGTIKRVTTAVTTGGTNYICDLKDDSNTFVVGDLVRCQRWDMSITPTDPLKYYWLEVTAVNQSATSRNSITIFVPTGYSGMTPAADDVIVQMGNTDSVNHADRQGFVIITDDGMSVYNGVNSTSLTGKLKSKFGNLNNMTWHGHSLSGYGLLGDSVYLSGTFLLESTVGGITTYVNIDSALGTITSSVSRVSDTLANGGVNLARMTNQGENGWSYSAKDASGTDISSRVTISANGRGVSFSMWDSSYTISDSAYQYFIFTSPFAKSIETNKKYVVSANILINQSEGDQEMYVRLIVGSNTYGRAGVNSSQVTISATGVWQRVEFPISSNKASLSTDVYLIIQFRCVTKSLSYLSVNDLKVEEGEIGTTYTIAPEDTTDSISEVRSEISQTAENISLSVVESVIDGNSVLLGKTTTPTTALNEYNYFTPYSWLSFDGQLVAGRNYRIVLVMNINARWRDKSLYVYPESTGHSWRHTITEDEVGQVIEIEINISNYTVPSSYTYSGQILFRLYGSDVSYDATDTSQLLEGYLYEYTGQTVGSLKQTGIDIRRGVIEMTANNVLVKNSLGQPTFLLNQDGTLKTNLIRAYELDADEINTNHLIARDEHGCVIATVNADYNSTSGLWEMTDDGAYRIYYKSALDTNTNEYVQNTNKKLEIKDVTYTIDNEDYVTTMRMFEPDGQTIAWELGTDAMTNGFVNPSQAVTVVKLVTGISDDDAKTTTTFDGKNYRIKPDPVDTATGEIYDVVSTGYYYDIYYQAVKSPLETTYTRDRYNVTQDQQTGVYEYVKDTISWTESNITINPHNNPS